MPPPPPPDDGGASPEAGDADRYLAYLKDRGRPSDSLREDTGLAVGGWRFFYREGDGRRDDAAGISADGATVDGFNPSDWFEFLTTPGVDGDVALRRIAWLLLRPGPVGPEYPFNDPEMAAAVGAPEVVSGAEAVLFRGWVIYPPEMQYPVRLTVSAKRGEKAVIDSVPWHELKE